MRQVALLLALLVAGGAVHAQDEEGRTIVLRWRAVPGASGYVVQIRNSQGEIISEDETEETELSKELTPGEYAHRIAAQNRFGETGPFSAWIKLSVVVTRPPIVTEIRSGGPRDEARGRQRVIVDGDNFTAATVVRLIPDDGEPRDLETQFINATSVAVWLSLRTINDGRYKLEIVNPRGLTRETTGALVVADQQVQFPEEPEPDAEEQASDSGSQVAFAALVPGLPASERDEPIGGLWAGAFIGLGALTLAELQAAEVTRDELVRNPLYRAFNEPLPLYLLASTTTSRETFALLAWQQDRLQAQARSDYRRHRERMYAYGGALAMTYMWHFASERDASMEGSHFVPGLTHFNKGHPGRGAAWVTATVGLAVGATLEYQKSERSRLSYSRAANRSFIEDPFFIAATLNGTLDFPDDLAYLGARANVRANQKLQDYKTQRSNAAGLAGGLLFVYLLQIIDASYLGTSTSLDMGVPGSNVAAHSSDFQPEFREQFAITFYFD